MPCRWLVQPARLCCDGRVTRLLLCLFFFCCTELARAQAPAQPTWLSTRINADPNGPAYGLEYRGAMRGRFGDQFDLYGAESTPGYAIALGPLFELHEPRKSSNVLPSQYWRARISLAQSYGFVLREKYMLRVGALLSHESDHETAHAYSRPGFLALNDLAARVQLAGTQRHVAWYALADARLYFLSCTEPSRDCHNFRGDQTFGGQLQLGLALTQPLLWQFVPFVAATFSGIVPHGDVIAERRLLTRLGVYRALGESLLSLFISGSVGNDVGIVRNRTLNVVGAGVSFTR